MLDVGWTELLLIGVVALIVIGPQDLPDMFRTLGRFTAKLRAMSRDFQRAMDQAAKESGVKDIARDLNTMTNPASAGLTAMKQAADRFEKWDPLKPSTGAKEPLKPAPMPSSAAAQATAASAAAANPALSPVGGLGKAADVEALAAEDLADAEPDLPRKVGPATQALYDKKAEAEAARAAKKAAASAPAAPPAPKDTPATEPVIVTSARKAGLRAPATPKAAPATLMADTGPAAPSRAPRSRKAAPPTPTPMPEAAAEPAKPALKTPRRRKADQA